MPGAQGGRASLYGSRGGAGLATKPTAYDEHADLLRYEDEIRSVKGPDAGTPQLYAHKGNQLAQRYGAAAESLRI